jgi:hypothetical protein
MAGYGKHVNPMDLEYTVCKPTSWHEAKNFLDGMDQYFVFRGQGNALWDLKNSFERCYFFGKNYRVEKDFLKDFQRGAYTYAASQNLPQPDDTLSWLALMQHHSAPTRLLDFSLSPYVASFFAFDNAEHDSAVWAIHRLHLQEDLSHKYPQAFEYRDDFMHDLPDRAFNQIFQENKLCCVFPVRPSVTNKRCFLQQSLFISAGNTEQAFMKQLLAYSWPEYLKEHVVKVILPITIKEEALYDLNRMNVNRSTLFPDLDGLSLYLKAFYELRYKGAQSKVIESALRRRAIDSNPSGQQTS